MSVSFCLSLRLSPPLYSPFFLLQANPCKFSAWLRAHWHTCSGGSAKHICFKWKGNQPSWCFQGPPWQNPQSVPKCANTYVWASFLVSPHSHSEVVTPSHPANVAYIFSLFFEIFDFGLSNTAFYLSVYYTKLLFYCIFDVVDAMMTEFTALAV